MTFYQKKVFRVGSAIKQLKYQAKVTYDNNLKYRSFYTTPSNRI